MSQKNRKNKNKTRKRTESALVALSVVADHFLAHYDALVNQGRRRVRAARRREGKVARRHEARPHKRIVARVVVRERPHLNRGVLGDRLTGRLCAKAESG